MVVAALLHRVPAHGQSHRLPSRVTRRIHVAQAKNDDAARKALQDMFKGRDDVLSQNEQTEEGGGDDDSGKGSGGGGGFGGFNFGEWWGGFSEWMDPYLRFLAAFIVLSFFPVVVDLATGGWKIIPQILSGPSWLVHVLLVIFCMCRIPMLQLLYSRRFVQRIWFWEDPDGKLGEEERDIMAKYGDGTDDVQ